MLRKTTVFLLACSAVALGGCNKITGGGWFESIEGGLVTYGFTAQPIGEAPGDCPALPGAESCWESRGHLTLIDHGTTSGRPLMIKGTFTGTFTGQSPLACSPDAPEICSSTFTGNAIVDGFDYDMRLRITDEGQPQNPNGDFFELFLNPTNGGPAIGPYLGRAAGGNLVVHQ